MTFDRTTHNVWGQPIKPKPYRPPQTAELAVVAAPADVATVPCDLHAVVEQVAVYRTITRICAPRGTYQCPPHRVYAPSPVVPAPRSALVYEPLPSRAREVLLWLAIGSGLGALVGLLVAVLVL